MYQYLDRPVADLSAREQFLLGAMRLWVGSIRSGRCACTALGAGFARQGAAPAARDFGIAMATLHRDGREILRFGPQDALSVTDDEARLLALYAAAFALAQARLRRIADWLVKPEAVERLATATQVVAAHLCQGVFMERDQ